MATRTTANAMASARCRRRGKNIRSAVKVACSANNRWHGETLYVWGETDPSQPGAAANAVAIDKSRSGQKGARHAVTKQVIDRREKQLPGKAFRI